MKGSRPPLGKRATRSFVTEDLRRVVVRPRTPEEPVAVVEAAGRGLGSPSITLGLG